MDRPTDSAEWPALLAARDGGAVPDGPLARLFAPVLAPPAAADGCTVLGRLAQTLDGRIATTCGASQWIGGPGDLLHTHRLRALCDVVLVGAGTVKHDDPRLTTRLCDGPSPVRVVVDTDRRLSPGFGVFQGGGPRTLLACAEDSGGAPTQGEAEVLRLPRNAAGTLDLPSLLRALAARGLRRIFVEGGGLTVSRFLAAGCLDRLHVTVAPVLLGSGIPAFTLPEAARIADGMRFTWGVHTLGDDVLFDIALNRARPAICETVA